MKNQISQFIGHRPTVKIDRARTERQFVACPYCKIGYAVAQIQVRDTARGEERRIEGLEKLQTCVSPKCGQQFRFQMKMTVIGVKP